MQMMRQRKRPRIDWPTLIAQAMLDLIISLILLIIQQMLK